MPDKKRATVGKMTERRASNPESAKTAKGNERARALTSARPATPGSGQPANTERQLGSFEAAMKLFHAREFKEAREHFLEAVHGPELDVAPRPAPRRDVRPAFAANHGQSAHGRRLLQLRGGAPQHETDRRSPRPPATCARNGTRRRPHHLRAGGSAGFDRRCYRSARAPPTRHRTGAEKPHSCPSGRRFCRTERTTAVPSIALS